MKKSHISICSILFFSLLITGCSKKRDKQDTLKIGVIHPDGEQESMPLGSQVRVYGSNNLVFDGVTNEMDGNIATVSFSVEDRLYGDDDKRIENISEVVVTHGDTISNVTPNPDFNLSNFTPNFNYVEGETDMVYVQVNTTTSFYGLFKGSEWYLVKGYANGVEGTLDQCGLDNVIQFSDWYYNVMSFGLHYLEGDDLCTGAGQSTLLYMSGTSFKDGTINGSPSKWMSLTGHIQFGGNNGNEDDFDVDKVHLIGMDTLVVSGEISGTDLDYYFVQ